MVTHWSHFRQWLKHTFKINYHDWVVVPNIFYYFYCHPYLGKIPNLTIIFFKWVGLTTTPTSLLPWQSLNPIPWLLENYTLNSRLAGSFRRNMPGSGNASPSWHGSSPWDFASHLCEAERKKDIHNMYILYIYIHVFVGGLYKYYSRWLAWCSKFLGQT